MAHLDLEEQEQIDQLKHFWNRWGNLITWAIIVVLGSYAAWMGWKYWQNQQAQKSAILFDTVEQAAAASDMVLFERSVSDMEEKFASTTYAQQSALLAARLFNEKGRVDDAKKHLQWTAKNATDEGYQALARLRLAGVLIQEKSYDEAAAQLKEKVPTTFQPLFDDRLGDIAVLQNRTDDAISYYQKAWKNFDDRADYRRIVEVKLASLGQAPESTPAVQDKK